MDDLETLKRMRRELGEASDQVIERSRAAMQELVTVPTPLPRRIPGRRRWVIAVPAVAACLALALVAQAILPSKHGGPPTASAALLQLAAVAGRQPDTGGLQPGEYLYRRSIGGWETHLYPEGSGQPGGQPLFTYQEADVWESWWGEDASGRQRYSLYEIRFPTPADEAAWNEAGSPALYDGAGTERWGPGEYMKPWDLSDLPTDPEEILAMMQEGKIRGKPWQDLLQDAYAPPAVRSAIFEAASKLDDVQWDGEMTDHLGRAGVAFTQIGPSGNGETWIFDPTTSMLLERHVEERDPYPSWTTNMAMGVTDSDTQTTDGWEPPGAAPSTSEQSPSPSP